MTMLSVDILKMLFAYFMFLATHFEHRGGGWRPEWPGWGHQVRHSARSPQLRHCGGGGRHEAGGVAHSGYPRQGAEETGQGLGEKELHLETKIVLDGSVCYKV